MRDRGSGALARTQRREAPVTWALIAITVGIHLAGVVVPPLQEAMFAVGAQDPLAVAAGRWHQLLTSVFLHSHDGQLVVWHVLFNMLWLAVLGRELEPRFGSGPFGALYLGSGLAGSAASQAAWHGGVGASGAVYGLLGVLFVEAARRRKEPGGKEQLRSWLWLLAFGLSMPLWTGPLFGRVGWAAHLGGLAAGVAISLLWTFGPARRAAGLRAGFAVGVAALSVALVLPAAAPPPAVALGAGDARAFAPAPSAEELAASLRASVGEQVVVTGTPAPGAGVVVDERVFGRYGEVDDELYDGVDTIEVRTSELAAARRALEAVAGRWLLIDATGREWSGEELDAAFDDPDRDGDIWTIPYVSEVEPVDGGLGVWIDTEGTLLEPPQQARFVAALVEELERAGVTRAHVVPAPRFIPEPSPLERGQG